MMDQMLAWTMIQRELIRNDRRFVEADRRSGEHHAPGGIFRTIWHGPDGRARPADR